MTIKKYSRFLLAASTSFLIALPFSVSAETIESSIVSALQNHPGVDAARAFLKASEADRLAERSGYFPEISVSGQGGRMYGDNATTRGLNVTRGAGYSNFWEGSANLKQTIFDGFGTSSRVAAAKARQKSANMDLLDVRESLALRASQSYIDLMRSHAALKLMKNHQAVMDDYLERIKISVDEGALDEAEYQQAMDSNVLLATFVTDYEGQAAAAEALYVEAVGAMPNGKMQVPTPNVDLLSSGVNKAIDLAKSNHPSLKSALYASKAAEETVDSERASFYPAFDGEVSYLQSDKEEFLGGEVEDARALVRMNWSFETGLGQFERVKKRKFEYNEAKARQRDVERQLERTIKQAYAEMKTAKQQLALQKKRYDLNKKLFSTFRNQFDAARVTLLQLMQAENQLFNVRLTKLNAEYQLLAAQYGVIASMGQLQNSVQLALASKPKAMPKKKTALNAISKNASQKP